MAMVLAACTNSPDAGTTAAEPAPAHALIAERLPRVEYLGGHFLRNPDVVTVTFADDDATLVARLEAFGETVTRSAWWRQVTDGYCARPGDCIGDGTGRHVRLDRKLPDEVSDADVEDLLTAAVDQLGPLDRETLPLLYLPAGVTFTDATRTYCGDGPRALHTTVDVDGRRVPYAVVPRCGDEADLTASASHEILEATTNPDPARRGFAFRGGSASGGFTAAGVEPADPCGLIAPGGRVTIDDGETVQLSVTLRRTPPDEFCTVGLVSTSGDARHLWPLTISTR